MNRNWIIFLLISILFYGCIEPFEFSSPPSESAIVVDATLTDQQRFQTITISKSYELDSTLYIPITNAVITITDLHSSEVIDFIHADTGAYTSEIPFKAQEGHEYQLSIELSDGRTYQSTPESLPSAAQLDSLYGMVVDLPNPDLLQNLTGVQFLISSQSTNPIWMRYEWLETYKIRMPITSLFIWDYDLIKPMPREVDLTICYQEGKSTTPVLATSAGLQTHRVADIPVTMAESYGTRLIDRYLLRIKQYSISEQAYKYHKELLENNEGAGSLADGQKGMIKGNLSSVTPSEIPILGYFEVASVDSTGRYFEPNDFIPDGFRPEFPCDPTANSKTFLDGDPKYVDMFQVGKATVTIVDSIFSGWPGTPFWYYVPNTCTDCTLFGQLEKPDIWED